MLLCKHVPLVWGYLYNMSVSVIQGSRSTEMERLPSGGSGWWVLKTPVS